MKRQPPSSPQLAEAELDRALDLLTAPRVPAGLAARIASHAVGLPQDIALTSSPRVRSAEVRVQRRTTLVAPVRRKRPGWQLGAGLGTIAAGLGVVALIGLPQSRNTVAVEGQVAAAAIRSDASPRNQGVALPAAAPVAVAVAESRSAPTAAVAVAEGRKAGVPTPGVTLADKVEAPLAPLEEPPSSAALAVAEAAAVDPAKPVAPGAGASAPVPGPRGQMGPVAPQGFGYTGGAIGGIPSGAPVTMSGGPGGNTHPF